MKARKNSGYAVIILNTDLERSVPFTESSLTEKQKLVLSKLSQSEQEKIREGYAVSVVNLESGESVCDFNKDGYKPPESAINSLARSLLPKVQKYYSNEENVKKFEEWKKNQDKK